MRRTGNSSFDPAIGSIGWATLKRVRELAGAADDDDLLAQPASAARPVMAPVDNTFLRSMTGLLDVASRREIAVLHWRP
jgi:hypothetical protein